MADSVPSSPVGLLLTVGASAYVAGRYMKKEGDSPLPSITALALTYVVFRGLDMLWPMALGAVQTTLPLNVGGISQAFKQSATQGISGGSPLSAFFNSASSPSRATVDGYTVK